MDEPDVFERWRDRLVPVVIDGVRMFTLDAGSGDAVVFLHGIPTHAFLWRDVADVVAREHRVIVPDLVGFGFSDRPDSVEYSPVSQARFLSRLLDERGVTTVTVVAHDYGALVAAEFVSQEPERVRRLVLTNTSLWKDDWRGGQINPIALLKLRGVGESAFRLARPFMLTRAFHHYASDRERLSAEVMRVYWHPFKHGFARVLLRLAREDALTDDDFCRWRDALHEFPNPALVVWGALDPTFRIDRGRALASMIPDAHLEVFEHANHFVPEDRPGALGRLINAFVAGRYPI